MIWDDDAGEYVLNDYYKGRLTLTATMLDDETGEPTNWSYTIDFKNETLTVCGEGEMPPVDPPWYNYRAFVKTLTVVGDNIIFCDLAFDGMESLTTVTVPTNIKSLGYGAFNGCKALTNINLGECASGATIGGREAVSC